MITRNADQKIASRFLEEIDRAAMALILIMTCLMGQLATAADDSNIGDKAKEAAQQTGAAIEDAGKTVANDAEQLWHRIDAARLKNRTRDEIVAWVIMGALVGALAGMMTSSKSSGLGRLVTGLAGACLGGMVVRVAHVDFGWGAVVITYEELLFSFLGAIVLIVLWRLMRSGAKKKGTAP